MGVDRLIACGKFGMCPPAVARIVGPLKVRQSRGVHPMSYHVVQEEVVSEEPASPAQVGMTCRVSDQDEIARRDVDSSLLTQLPGRCIRRCLARLDATAWSEPDISELRLPGHGQIGSRADGPQHR
jgi:hypothetical protein